MKREKKISARPSVVMVSLHKQQQQQQIRKITSN